MNTGQLNFNSSNVGGDTVKYTKEVEDMAVLTKPVNKMLVIDKDSSKKFISDFNRNKVTDEFLKSCQKAGKLFGDRDDK